MRKLLALIVCVVTLVTTPATALEPDREEPHHVRMLVETGVYMLFGTIWYFSGQDLNAPDWDLEVTGDSLKLKFLGLSQIRFDNNTFLFNQAYHPFAHAGIYLTGRSNDMGPYLSFTYTFFASLFWEYIGELREKVSVNDMIVSPLTAMAWGEVAHQYAEYFVSSDSEGKWAHKVLTGFFALPRLFHDWMDGEKPTQFSRRRFFPEPRASLVAGVRTLNGRSRVLTSFALESELAVMPGFGEIGKDTQFFRDGNFSQFGFEFQWTPEQLEVDIDATATISGFYSRDIGRDGAGIEWMIGAGRGYRLLSRDGKQFIDRIGLAHVLGPTFRLRLHGSEDFRVDVGINAFFDFTAIRSLAVPQFFDSVGAEGFAEVRTDVQKHSYYFAYGYTIAPSIGFEWNRWRLDVETNISQARSIQGLDRFEEDVTRKIILKDVFWENRAVISIPSPIELLDLRLQWHSETRISRLENFREERKYQELQMGIQSRF